MSAQKKATKHSKGEVWDLCCAALERREDTRDFLVVEMVGGIAGLRGRDHEVGHDLAVDVGAQADGNKLVAETKTA